MTCVPAPRDRMSAITISLSGLTRRVPRHRCGELKCGLEVRQFCPGRRRCHALDRYWPRVANIEAGERECAGSWSQSAGDGSGGLTCHPARRRAATANSGVSWTDLPPLTVPVVKLLFAAPLGQDVS